MIIIVSLALTVRQIMIMMMIMIGLGLHHDDPAAAGGHSDGRIGACLGLGLSPRHQFPPDLTGTSFHQLEPVSTRPNFVDPWNEGSKLCTYVDNTVYN
jgi:hypothetical protein